MTGASRDCVQHSDPLHGQTSKVVQVAVIVLTGVVGLTASAALAWTLRGWREGAPVSVSVSVAPAERDVEPQFRGAGRLAYQVHCVRCHGAEGHGDGSDAERLLPPPPRDFASEGWRFAPTANAIRKVIVDGIPGTAMPGWGASLSTRELEGLVAHVLSLAPRSRRDDASKALTTLLAGAGFSAELVPRAAPPLTLRDLDGHATTLDERLGRPVLILFWGTTCAPCLAEMPAAVRFLARHRDTGSTCCSSASTSPTRRSSATWPAPGRRNSPFTLTPMAPPGSATTCRPCQRTP